MEQKNWFVWAVWTLADNVCGYCTAMLAEEDKIAKSAVDWAVGNASIYSETVTLFAVDSNELSPLAYAQFIRRIKLGLFEDLDKGHNWQTKVKFLGRRNLGGV